VQYLSCLMYSKAENPVFAPWTREEGGGPPCLWGYDGYFFEHRWLAPNVALLEAALTPTWAASSLARAARRLEGEPEHTIAAGMLEDLPLCEDTLAARCAELPRLLATVQLPDTLLEWTR